MLKVLSFLVVLAFATVVVADAEVPLPGPGAPPTQPAPPQPTPPMAPTPTPPPYDPNPEPTPYYPTPTPYPTPYPGNPSQDTTYTLGRGQVSRFKDRSFTFSPPSSLRNIRALRVTCTNEKIKIKTITVKFTNGQSLRQPVLEGLYRTGDSKISYLSSAAVVSVTVTAGSSSVFRTDGTFQLDAAASPAKSNDVGDGSGEDPINSAPIFEGDNGAF